MDWLSGLETRIEFEQCQQPTYFSLQNGEVLHPHTTQWQSEFILSPQLIKIYVNVTRQVSIAVFKMQISFTDQS